LCKILVADSKGAVRNPEQETETKMKAQHRHELKTNVLAEWIGNLPEWVKSNYKTIIIVCAVVVVAFGSYFYFVYERKAASAREQLRLTELTRRARLIKADVIGQRQSGGQDISYLLLQVANELEGFARGAKEDGRAALALIERGAALRAELHYRAETVRAGDLQTQINLAKVSYDEALGKLSSNSCLAAQAKMGLGLCEEELSNFEGARQIYEDLVGNPEFESTTAVVQARGRLGVIDEYKERVVFRAAPKPTPPAPLSPPSVGPPVPLRPPEIDSVGSGGAEGVGASASSGGERASAVEGADKAVDINVAAP
jgi:hypothetical protein